MPLYLPNCRIVGVDIGSRAIKVVQLTTSWRGFTVTGFWVREHQVTTWAELSAELRSLFQEHRVQGDIFVTSFPGHQVLFRNTELPFSQLGKIEATIRFEAESIMAVPLDGMVVDFALIEGRPDGSTVLVTCVQEELLQDYVRALHAADVVPDTIDIDALALARLMEELHEARTIALLDVGVEKVSIGIFSKGKLRYIRAIPTEATAKATWKKLRSAIDEVRLSINAYQGVQGGQLDELWLTGGGSTITEIADYLHKEMGVQVSYPPWMKHVPCRVPVTEEMNLLGGVALGLALRGLRSEQGRVDLARRIATPAQSLSPVLRTRVRRMALAAIILVILVAAHFFVGIVAQERRYSLLKDEMHRVFQKVFPEAKGAANEVQQARALIKAMGERGVKIKTTSGGTPLEMIREIAQLLPQQTKIVEIDIDEGRVTLRGMAPSFAAVDEVKRVFTASQLFHEVTTGTVELARRGEQGVIFNMVLALGAP